MRCEAFLFSGRIASCTLVLLLGLAATDVQAERYRNRSFSDKPRTVSTGVASAAVLGSVAWIAAHGAPAPDGDDALGLTNAQPTGATFERREATPIRRGEFTGIVTRVTDGDTVWVALPAGSQPVKVRLEGIDAPERCQAWGAEATAALTQRLLNRAVTARLRSIDRYGRYIGKILDDTEDVGQRLVKDGHAWSIRYRWDRGPYVAEERMAKALNRGLHANREAIEPRAFRQQHGACKSA